MSVLSACHVFILLHCVSLCSVVFLYSLSGAFCPPVLTSGPFFQCEALFLHLYLRHCPHGVSRLCPCFSYWGFVLILYWGFVLIFVRLHPCILFWGFILIFYFEALSSYLWGFILVFYFEASFSYFILRLCPHICYRGFVLIFDLRFHPHGYILRLFLSLRLICVWFCLFVFLSGVIRCKYYLVWIFIQIFYQLLCLFLDLRSCNLLFWFTCCYIIFYLWFCWLPCFDMCGHNSPVFIVTRQHNALLYASLSTSHHCF